MQRGRQQPVEKKIEKSERIFVVVKQISGWNCNLKSCLTFASARTLAAAAASISSSFNGLRNNQCVVAQLIVMKFHLSIIAAQWKQKSEECASMVLCISVSVNVCAWGRGEAWTGLRNKSQHESSHVLVCGCVHSYLVVSLMPTSLVSASTFNTSASTPGPKYRPYRATLRQKKKLLLSQSVESVVNLHL